LLIETKYISTRVSEPRGDLWRIDADWLYEFAPVGKNRLYRGGDTIHHDVYQQARRCRGWSFEDPCTGHFTYPIIEGDGAIVAPPDPPAEDFLVEPGRTIDIDCGHFDVADLPVR
jgi:hypothetical protein